MATPSVIAASEVSPLQLALTLQRGDLMQILDVRLPAAVAEGRIDLGASQHFYNILGSQVMSRANLDGTGIDSALPLVVVCGRGRDSLKVAEHLNRMGCCASSLRGGMAAWMSLALPRHLGLPPSLDDFVQFDRVGKAALSYLLVSDGEALVVDPPRDITPVLEAVRSASARIVGVADTHVHADYISGARMLSQTLGIPYYLHPRDAIYPYDGTMGVIDFHPIADGDRIHLGRCAVRVVHTPGHTEGSVCYVIDEQAVLTGDFVFVASVGRPDLAGKTDEWTGVLWQSLQAVRQAWAPDMTIYPAHYASADERRPDAVIGARFGVLLERSDVFRSADAAEFRRWVAARTGSFPESYKAIKAINVGLLSVDDETAATLEFGRNQCALQQPPR